MNAVAPPGPKGRFLLGHMLDFRANFLEFLTRCAREYGDFVPLRFGPRRLVLLSHPDLIEYPLVRDHRNFMKSLGERVVRSVTGDGLFVSEGEFWLRQRRMMQPAFHRERVAAYAAVMVEYAERLTVGWVDGEIRNMHEDMTSLTLQIVAKTLFDADVAEDAPEVGEAMTLALACLNSRLQGWPYSCPMSSRHRPICACGAPFAVSTELSTALLGSGEGAARTEAICFRCSFGHAMKPRGRG